MKHIFFMAFMFITSLIFSQNNIIGIWYNVDDEDGKPKSHIKIYERNGKLEGEVIKLLPAAKTTICNNCEGPNKGKSIVGMKILWDLQKESNTFYEDGEILNPKNGKIYSCNLELIEPDKLKVRGYLGFSLIGKTQYWYRVK